MLDRTAVTHFLSNARAFWTFSEEHWLLGDLIASLGLCGERAVE
jgi:hypothetical protein